MKIKTLVVIGIFLFAAFSLRAQESKPAAPTNEYQTPQKPTKEPETAEEFYEAARWESLSNRNDAAAVKYLDRAIELKPDLTAAYWLRGILKSQQGDCKAAIADFDIVIVHAADAVNTYQYRGECKIVLKDYIGALSDLDMSVANLAANGLVQYNAFVKRGKLKYIMQNYDGAIEDFTSAVRMGRSDGSQFFRAMTYLKKGDVNSSINDLTSLADHYEQITKEVRQQYPNQYSEKEGYPGGENPLATLKPRKGPEALGSDGGAASYSLGSGSASCDGCSKTEFPDFEEKLIPDNWFFPNKKTYLPPSVSQEPEVIFFLLGSLQVENGNIDAAIKSFTKSLIAKGYDEAPIYFQRGKLLLKAGNFEPAVRDFSWTISERRKFADAYIERGIAIFMLGHDALAQKDFDTYLVLNPGGKDVLLKRSSEAKTRRKELKKENAIRK